jgi:hypothetical protein
MGLTGEMIQTYKTFFDYVDGMTNKNGKITRSEIVKACTPDINNNGVVDVIKHTDTHGSVTEQDELDIGERNALHWVSKIPKEIEDDALTWEEYLRYVDT